MGPGRGRDGQARGRGLRHRLQRRCGRAAGGRIQQRGLDVQARRGLAVARSLALDPGRCDDGDWFHGPDRAAVADTGRATTGRSEEHTSELQSLMRTSYAVFSLQKTTPTQAKTAHEST